MAEATEEGDSGGTPLDASSMSDPVIPVPDERRQAAAAEFFDVHRAQMNIGERKWAQLAWTRGYTAGQNAPRELVYNSSPQGDAWRARDEAIVAAVKALEADEDFVEEVAGDLLDSWAEHIARLVLDAADAVREDRIEKLLRDVDEAFDGRN